jgi:hypothetical protein
MSLNDAQITELCETFRLRAKTYRQKAQETTSSREVVMFPAFSSTLHWAIRELCLVAGIDPTRDTPTSAAPVERESTLADAAHDAEDLQP